MKKLFLEIVFLARTFTPKQTTPKIIFTEYSHDLDDEMINLVRTILTSDSPYLDSPLRRIEGMSGNSFRYLLNRISSNYEYKGAYLEVGTFKGSTAIAALSGNNRFGILIDNWSEFGGPKKKADLNLSKHGIGGRYTLLDRDFNKFNVSEISNEEIGIYFYDGGHSVKEQTTAMRMIDALKFERLVLIVDDWCWQDVQIGTRMGLDDLTSSKVICSWQIFPDPTDKTDKYGQWHNGYFLALLRKNID